MKVMAFNSSPWGLESNTQIMLDSILGGARQAGAQTETIALKDYDIRPCTGCLDCQFKTPGICPIPDDVAGLVAEFLASDIAVFATPLYIDNITGIMKVFLDRFIMLLDPHFEKGPDGNYRHRPRHKNCPKLVAVANGHLPEFSQFDVLRLYFRRLARTLHTVLAAEIYCPAGGLLRGQEPTFAPLINRYRLLLQQAGSELVKSSGISEPTAGALEQPFIAPENYVRYANKQWDLMLSQT